MLLRSDIEDNTSRGIDTSVAEAKYIEAEREIASARARPAAQYAGALDDLEGAHTAIAEGAIALDKAWAESEVAGARVPVDNAAAVIGWFEGSNSTAHEPGLDQIVAKRNIAVKYLSAANREITNGSYTAARANALEAYNAGNESYHEALDLMPRKTCTGCDLPPPLFVYVATGIVADAFLCAGIFWWRTYKV